MKKNFTWLLLTVSLFFSLPLLAQNSAISLNGVDNSVTTAAHIVPQGADFTVEFWAYVPSLLVGQHQFVSQGSGVAPGGFYIGYDGATGFISAGDAWASTGAVMPVGRWFHLAFTFFQATTTANVYIDDVIMATNTTYGGFSAGGQNFAIGRNYSGNQFVQAEMDEIRVWNVARTSPAIKGSMFHGATTTDPNLIAYYQANEGSGTTLGNSSSTAGLNGTINGTLGAQWASSPIQFALNAIAFDGVSDDKLVVPANALWDGLSSATIELDINPGTNAASGDMIGVRGVGGTKFSFSIFNNAALTMYNGGASLGVGVPLAAGTWYHLSFVVDGVQDTTGVFVDGVYIGQIPISFGALTGQPLVMGVSQNAGSDAEFYNGSMDEVRIWNTMLTQAQIQAQMGSELVGNEPGLVALYSMDQGVAAGNNSFMTTVIDGTASNNHGQLQNFALTGATSNFVTGATITPLPVNFTFFTAVSQGKTAMLKWETAQEQNSRDYTIMRSTDGSPNSFTAIGTVPAAGNSSTKLDYSFQDISPLLGMNYYQLKETDLDNRFMFSVIKSLRFNSVGAGLVWQKNGDRSVEVALLQGNTQSYLVTDMLGRTVQKGQLSFGKMYLSHVSPGMYTVRVFYASGSSLTTKVLVQ